MYSAPDKDTAQNSNNIFISVLTDNKTYSSATMFAVWVADGGFGNIVGEPSRNAVSDFGDTLSLRLPQSGLNLGVSHKRFLRPDSNADPDIVMPDIMVDSKKAFDHALDFLRNMK